MKTAYILSTGESLKGKDLSFLNGKEVFAVNRAYYNMKLLGIKSAPYHVFHDRLLWNKFEKKLLKSKAELITLDRVAFKDIDITKYKESDSGSGDTLTVTFNSGVLAVKIAVKRGYKRIFLLGIDTGFEEQPHFLDEKLSDRVMKRLPIIYQDNIPEYDAINGNIITVGRNCLRFKNISFNEFRRRHKSSG